jgi:hypothetical protein
MSTVPYSDMHDSTHGRIYPFARWSWESKEECPDLDAGDEIVEVEGPVDVFYVEERDYWAFRPVKQ